jgi:hypothetical protein
MDGNVICFAFLFSAAPIKLRISKLRPTHAGGISSITFLYHKFLKAKKDNKRLPEKGRKGK